MMKFQNKFRRYLLALIIVATPSLGFSQTIRIETIADTTDIKGQFEYLLKKSNRYQEFKVIPISGYNFVKNNSLDSIKKYKGEIVSRQEEIFQLSDELAAKNTEINRLSEELSASQADTNSMNLLGANVSKGTYSAIMWILVIVLASILALVYLLYKRGHQVVKSTKQRLMEVQEEFETHRKNTLVREQKLARELMDVKLKSRSR